MAQLIDITGQKFGRYTVLGQAESKHGKTYWLCRCECGNERTVQGTHLKMGRAQSCGCLAREQRAQKAQKKPKKAEKPAKKQAPRVKKCYNVFCPYRNNAACGGVWSCTNFKRCANRQEWRVGVYDWISLWEA